MSEKWSFFSVFGAKNGCFWAKMGLIWVVIMPFLVLFRAFLGVKSVSTVPIVSLVSMEQWGNLLVFWVNISVCTC